MITLPLMHKDGHIFVELDEGRWLLDTGAPSSFGEINSLTVETKKFALPNNFSGLTAATLSEHIGTPCRGLLGADILGCFDHILDCANGTLSISTDELLHNGQEFRLSMLMGIPILTVQISGRRFQMFFDTGAQISYLQDDTIRNFPTGESITYFYPGFGQFKTDTYQVDISLGDINCKLVCGTLPGLLGNLLLVSETQGIIGNQIFDNRVIGYFPRRNALYL